MVAVKQVMGVCGARNWCATSVAFADGTEASTTTTCHPRECGQLPHLRPIQVPRAHHEKGRHGPRHDCSTTPSFCPIPLLLATTHLPMRQQRYVMLHLRERLRLQKKRQLTYLYGYKNLRSIISNKRLTISTYRKISDRLSVGIGRARF